MSSGPVTGESAADKAASQKMFTGWQHLQRTLGGTFNASVKRSRKLAQAQLRRKG